MKKKNEWEIRKIKTASLSLKKTIPIPVEDELDYFISVLGIGGYTKLNMEFLLSKSGLTKKEFDEKILNYIIQLAKIRDREYPQEFRKFAGQKVLENCDKKEQKERWKNYVEKKEYL